MNYLNRIHESQLLSSLSSYKNYSAKQIAELVYLHILALKILYSENATHDYARSYATRSARYVGFARYYQSATDLHLLVHALVDEDVNLRFPDASLEFKEGAYFDTKEIMTWLKALSQNREIGSQTRRLFMSLDGQLHIKDSQLKAVRRLAQDWPTNTLHQKRLAMTRLLQIMRVRASKSDLLKQLEAVSSFVGLELKNVANPETGDAAPADKPVTVKKPSLLARIATFAAAGVAGYAGVRALGEGEEETLEEDGGAAAPAAAVTTTSSVAQCNTTLGKPKRRKP